MTEKPDDLTVLAELNPERDELDAAIETMIADMAEAAPEAKDRRLGVQWRIDPALSGTDQPPGRGEAGDHRSVARHHRVGRFDRAQLIQARVDAVLKADFVLPNTSGRVPDSVLVGR